MTVRLTSGAHKPLIRALAFLALFVMLPTFVWADDWVLPVEPVRALSQNKVYQLTVVPNGVALPDDAPKDIAEFRVPDGPCFAYMETADLDGSYTVLWSGHLANPISPLDMLVSNKGQVVTFDDWGNAGHGPNAIVLYDAQGEVLRQVALADVLTGDILARLKHSTSSIWWRSSAAIDDSGGTVAIKVDMPEQKQFELRDGLWVRLAPPSPYIVIALADGTVLRTPKNRPSGSGMVR